MRYKPKRGVQKIEFDDVLIRYEYDPGEEQWFDARAGVGSPGYGPEVNIVAINRGNGWGDSWRTYPLRRSSGGSRRATITSNALPKTSGPDTPNSTKGSAMSTINSDLLRVAVETLLALSKMEPYEIDENPEEYGRLQGRALVIASQIAGCIPNVKVEIE